MLKMKILEDVNGGFLRFREKEKKKRREKKKRK